ncbi:glycosyltransferase family 4 protein [Collinsella sp. HCP3S3_B1]|uniref:glycosyltransferase family 4 protein n=1 Tax=unclassified Collinsella TaxID=2637548 RepID=UPI003F88D0AA
MLVLYDTTNYVDHPIGGQLTSVRNFLRFLAEEEPSAAQGALLVGVTKDPRAVGIESKVEIGGVAYRFLPVAYADTDLAHVQGSLRMRFAKGLLKYVPKIGLNKGDVNFIHTPEAFGPVKVLGRGRCVVMSHGSFLHMKDNLRFYKKSWLADAFQRYLVWVIKKADRLLVLDEGTKADYEHLNDDVRIVSNSIDHREKIERDFDPKAVRLLFVGRLSAVKNIGPIIEAAEAMPEVESLAIVGDGEEREHLKALAGRKASFKGSLETEGVRAQMRDSDILVMNSLHEGVPMTILEAMGMGMPIISTDVGGISAVAPFGSVAERTDGTARSIADAVRTVADCYAELSAAAYAKSADFDFRVVNGRVFGYLGVCR